MGYPAAYNGVIAAGSCTAGGNKSSFSCYGAGLDLLAPGDMVLSTSPKFKGSYYSVVSGTSFSAPHVAAVAALLLSKYPNLTPGWIQAILQGSASRPSGYNEIFMARDS
ncbi:MAG: hypothetical protein A2W01_09655 [Candidatus Solincola sediminis]|nr:MAG: hypothetical protein A2W01_09655 [Candidatus Solincola sediminis]